MTAQLQLQPQRFTHLGVAGKESLQEIILIEPVH